MLIRSSLYPRPFWEGSVVGGYMHLVGWGGLAEEGPSGEQRIAGGDLDLYLTGGDLSGGTEVPVREMAGSGSFLGEVSKLNSAKKNGE